MAERVGLGDVLVLGLGRSGRAAARYLAARLADGSVASVTVLDERGGAELEATAAGLRQLGVRVTLDAATVDGSYDLCVASPGIAPIRPLMRSALAAASRTISEIEFAFERSVSPWIAITGTNGKTTTTSLVGHLLMASGIPAEVVGNIGRPAIDVAEDASASTAIVAEVSSFQLAFTDRFHPRVSVLLNVSPDHLDWHGSLEAYAADKARIFANQGPDDVAVIDVDDEGAAPYAERVEAQGTRVVRVSRQRVPAGGAGVRDGVLVLDTGHGPVELVAQCDLLIRGDHNVSNALAAAAAASAFGAPTEEIRVGLKTFEPIEHRLEPVAEIDGVAYVNDSKATNPDAVLKALTAFADQPLVLLLGGRNKDNDFVPLAEAAARRCRAVVLFGEARGELEAAFAGRAVAVHRADGLAEAVSVAREIAEPGDAVLLSPACASFDEFSGFEERGRTFRDLLVRDLPEACTR